MYQQAAQAQTAGNGAATDGGGQEQEEVVDAEVVDEGNK
jgi:hypothetical protein